MDVVIPLANNKSKSRDDFEIHHCLRSIEKFVNPLGNVFIVGYCPPFVTNVNHLPLPDSYVIKDANIINKVLYACYNGVDETFIRMSDDEYFLKPYEIGIYSMGDLKDKKDEGWHKTAFNTRDILISKGLPTKNYDTHTPQFFVRDAFVSVILQSNWAQGDGVLANSYCLNASRKNTPTDGNPNVNRFKAPHDEYVLDGDFLNHNDAGLTPKLRSIIEKLFPDKSRYEL